MLRLLRLAPLALVTLLWPLAPAAQPTYVPDLPTLPEVVGVGGAAAGAPTSSPFAVFVNPALLADAGAKPGLRLGTSVAPSLLGDDNLLVGTGAGSIGLRTAVGGRPLFVTLAGGYREVNIDNQPRGGGFAGEYDTMDLAYGGGLALGWQGPVMVRVGAAAFAREAPEQSDVVTGELDRDRAVTLDVGAAVTVPLLAGPAINETAPQLSLTLGAVRQSIELQNDPFPRVGLPAPSAQPGQPPAQTDRYGASADLSIVRRFGARGRLAIARFSVRGEQRTAGGGTDHLGGAVTLAETVTLRGGLERRDVGVETETRTAVGFGFSLDGFIRALGAWGNNPRLLAASDRLTLRGDLARYDLGGVAETDYAGVTFGWRP